MKELSKYFLAFALFAIFSPLLGFLIRKNVTAQRVVMFAICFMTIQGFFEAVEMGFTLMPMLYRGHARGFPIFFIEVLAWALIWARCIGDWKNFKLFPPGVWYYLGYCFLSMLSVLSLVFDPIVAWDAAFSVAAMAAFKFLKATLLFVAAYNYVRNHDDLRFFAGAMSLTMLWETMVVLKLKYLNGMYQVRGTFEHQNSLSMFTSMIGMVLLAFALGRRTNVSALAFLAYIGCAVISQSTLSRAGLAIFGGGTVLVLLFSLWDNPTKRRWIMTGSLGVVAAIGLAMTMDTIIQRFNEYGTEESAMTRKNLNKAAWMMVNDYPLGVGWNNFARVINHPYPYGTHIDQWHLLNGNPVDTSYQKGIVESWYHLTLSETGWQGLFGLILLIFVFLYWNLRAIWHFRGTITGAVSIGIFTGCFINYVQSFLERVLTQPRNLFLWLLLLGITAKIERWRRDEVQEARREAMDRVRNPNQRVDVTIEPSRGGTRRRSRPAHAV